MAWLLGDAPSMESIPFPSPLTRPCRVMIMAAHAEYSCLHCVRCVHIPTTAIYSFVPEWQRVLWYEQRVACKHGCVREQAVDALYIRYLRRNKCVSSY